MQPESAKYLRDMLDAARVIAQYAWNIVVEKLPILLREVEQLLNAS
jgi:uncharacterized protein with HEPN domain